MAPDDPGLVWDMSRFRGGPEQPVYEGAEDARRFMEDWAGTWEDWTVEAESFHDAGDSVVMVVRQRGRSKTTGISIHMVMAMVYTLRDGKEVAWSCTRSIRGPRSRRAGGLGVASFANRFAKPSLHAPELTVRYTPNVRDSLPTPGGACRGGAPPPRCERCECPVNAQQIALGRSALSSWANVRGPSDNPNPGSPTSVPGGRHPSGSARWCCAP
jgi:hypothetical protein